MHWRYLEGDDGVVTSRSCELRPYLYICKAYNNYIWQDGRSNHALGVWSFTSTPESPHNKQTWQDRRPASTDCMLQVRWWYNKLGNVTSNNTSISFFKNTIKTKFVRTADQHTLTWTCTCNWWWCYHNQVLCLTLMTLSVFL